MSGWFQEKSGDATKTASETGQTIQDRAVEAKDQTGAFLGEKSEAVTKAASETTEAAKKMGGEAMGKASETVEAGKDHAVEGKDQTGSFFGDKTDAVKKTATETADATKEKSTEAAQHVQDTAAQYTKDTPVAPKENVFQQVNRSLCKLFKDNTKLTMSTNFLCGLLICSC
uniref:Uncharacterized protein n=1 Tax=Triticum urartu TaxID=4572 RepID=A0A8R7QHV4_TRIUA